MSRLSSSTLLCAVATAAALGLAPLAASAGDDHDHGRKGEAFNRIAAFPVFKNTDVTKQTVAEIVAASTDGKTLIYTDSARKGVGFVNIADPSQPKPLGFIPLNGEPTSVAVRGPYVLAAVDTSAGNFVDSQRQA